MWPIQFGTDEELQRLLAEDDAKREKEGQPGRWASTAWQ
jgi:hypothetical protein